MKNRKNIVLSLGLGCVMLLILVFAIGRMRGTPILSPIDGVVLLPTPTPDPDRPRTILLLGYGGGKHEGGKISDTIIVARIDPKQKKTTLISIPRDVWVKLPISSRNPSYKINAAFAIGSDDINNKNKPSVYTGKLGGGNLAKYVVGNVVGFNIDYFVSVSFDGFTKSIDTLGGVDIVVPRAFEDPFYPVEGKETDTCDKSEVEIKALEATLSGDLLEQSFTCRFETLKFGRGTIHMDGATALKYVRSRHSPTEGNDFSRGARQRALIEAVSERVFTVGFIPKIVPFITSITRDVQTDIPLVELLPRASEFKAYPVGQISLTMDNVLTESMSDNHQYILVPKAGEHNWNEIHTFIQTQISSTASSTIK